VASSPESAPEDILDHRDIKKDDMELPQVCYTKMTAKKGEEGDRALMTKGKERERVGLRMHLGRQR